MRPNVSFGTLFAEDKDKNVSKMFFFGGSLILFLMERGINRKCKK